MYVVINHDFFLSPYIHAMLSRNSNSLSFAISTTMVVPMIRNYGSIDVLSGFLTTCTVYNRELTIRNKDQLTRDRPDEHERTDEFAQPR